MVVIVFINVVNVNAQYASSVDEDLNKVMLPKAFALNEYEVAASAYANDYHHILEVCDNNMELAFEKWLNMLVAIEANAQQEGIDLKGVKMWMKVYFKESGKIDHIGYYLKPDSKNISSDVLNPLFERFIKKYQFPLETDKKFLHYTVASFPVYDGK